MRARGAIIQGALAVIGLGAAYATWQREPDRATGEVVVLDVSRKEVSKIRYDDGKKWIEIEPGSGDEVWLHVGPRPEQKTPERSLRGSEQALRLLASFAPLRATRALGALPVDKLKELGLDAPHKRLEVTARGARTVLLAGYSPFGASSPYVKDERDGRVYMLAGSTLSDLDAAPGWLVERRLHSFQPAEYDGMTITLGGAGAGAVGAAGGGGARRELVQTGAASPATARLASRATPDRPDEMAKSWHDKLWRLAAVDVLGKGELPAGGDPASSIVLRVDYAAGGKSIGHVEIGRVQGPPPTAPAISTAPPPPPPVAELYARSELSVGWIKLPVSSAELVKEAEKVAATQ